GGCAEAALERVLLVKRLLERRQRVVWARQAFHRAYRVTVGLHREHEAGTDGRPVDLQGAGAADAVLPADVRSRQACLAPAEIAQQEAWFDVALESDAIDRDRDEHVRPRSPSPARSRSALRGTQARGRPARGIRSSRGRLTPGVPRGPPPRPPRAPALRRCAR